MSPLRRANEWPGTKWTTVAFWTAPLTVVVVVEIGVAVAVGTTVVVVLVGVSVAVVVVDVAVGTAVAVRVPVGVGDATPLGVPLTSPPSRTLTLSPTMKSASTALGRLGHFRSAVDTSTLTSPRFSVERIQVEPEMDLISP